MGAEFYEANYTEVFLKVVCHTMRFQIKNLQGRSMQRGLLSLLLLIFLQVSLQGAQLSHQKKILAFGDSITYGNGANPDQSYPAQLAKLIHQEVINAGVPGENSTQGLERLEKLLKSRNDIKIMILCHGANDILHNASQTRLYENIKKMIKIAKTKDIKVLLLGVVNFQINNLQTLPLYKKIAKEEDVAYNGDVLKIIEAKPSLKSDPIHPNAKGYAVMAETIYASLREAKLLK